MITLQVPITPGTAKAFAQSRETPVHIEEVLSAVRKAIESAVLVVEERCPNHDCK